MNHESKGRKHMRAWTGAAIAIAGLVTGSARASSDAYTVVVTMASIISHHDWFDPWQFGNNTKPDFFGHVRLLDTSLNIIADCGETPVMPNLIVANFPAGTTLCSGVAPIIGPFIVEVEVRDADWNFNDPTAVHDPADQADIAPGPANVWRSFQIACTSNCVPQAVMTAGDHATAIFTIVATNVANSFTTPPAVNPSQFDPSLNERAYVSGKFQFPTRLNVKVRPGTSGPFTTIVSGAVTQGYFNFDFDGRVSPGSPQIMPLGPYQVVVEGIDGSPSATMNVTLIKRNPGELLLLGLQPGPSHSPFGAPFEFNMQTTSPGVVTHQIRGPMPNFFGNCASTVALGQLEISRQVQSVTATTFTMRWDGAAATGGEAPAGKYCAYSSAVAAGTSTAMTVNGSWQVLDVLPPPALFVHVRTDPAVPVLVPGTPVRVIARVYDANHRPVAANTITLRAGPYSGPNSAAPVTQIVCRYVQECSVTMTPAMLTFTAPPPGTPPGTPPMTMVAGTLAYNASAANVNDTNRFDSESRLTDITPPPAGSLLRVFRANVGTGPGSQFGAITETFKVNGLDAVFYPGTGYDLASPSGAREFADIVGTTIDGVLGFAPAGGQQSSLFDNLPNFSGWASSTAHQIGETAGANTSASNLCRFGPTAFVSWANSNGVLHKVNCRDNAPGNSYSSVPDWRITWHELHHAAFGLADEYCCDGGYFEANPYPNVMRNLGSCAMNGSTPSACAPIDPSNTGGWHRSDGPAPDVMSNDMTIEKADDLRRANYFFDQCHIGGC